MANTPQATILSATEANAEGAAADTQPMTPAADQLPEISDWLPQAWVPYWEYIAQYPALGALVIAVVFYFAAFAIRAVLVRSISKLTAKTETDLDDKAINALRRPIFNTVFLFGATLAVKAAKLPVGTDFIINLLLSLIAVTLMRAAYYLCGELLDSLSRNHHRFAAIEERTIPLFDLVAKLMILLVGSYALLMIWGINPVGWLASAGIVGLAVGFAAKDTLANLFAGFFILVDSPYKVGDYINLDTGERGQVTHIGMRSTRLLTRDDVEITLPNAVIANAKVTNESGGPEEKMRVRISVGVAYGSDVHEVSATLEKIAIDNPDVCATPVPRVRMRAFGESSLDFQLLAWIEKPEDRGRISHELYMQVYDGLNRAGIEIPYAKRDLYIKEMPAALHGVSN